MKQNETDKQIILHCHHRFSWLDVEVDMIRSVKKTDRSMNKKR